MLPFSIIEQAYGRIHSRIHKTPVVTSKLLNQWLGHQILFKAECLQKVGAFKARGALNTIAHAVEQNISLKHIVANSSGNHAQGVAWAAQQYNIPATIFMPENVSRVKAQATANYGANVVLLETRAQVDAAVEQAAEDAETLWIPPYNHQDVIAGQGTAALEAFDQIDATVDALFAPCGGGGLVSGSLITARAMSPKTKVIGVEPLEANDAAESLRAGVIKPLKHPATTIADGARTPSVGPITFEHLQELDGFYEAEEKEIIYWTQWLTHLLKLNIEPTSAMSMIGVKQWLKNQKKSKTVLVILTGGNIDQHTHSLIWKEDFLGQQPTL
ncbi:MAG: serine/threonine dehydratase [Gammaproteobacteria bacterium]|nr:serine/threonine dehydratase [Gammaproteobacteria bacterium]